MPKIKIHPLFLSLLIILMMTGKLLLFVNMIAAVIIHELAHSRVAHGRGYMIESMTLMPYGAVLSGNQNIARDDAAAIYIAGPVFNAIVALFVISLWWLIPAIYSFTRLFVVANLTIAIFNLIPLYPLDGAKIVMNLFNNRIRAINIMQKIGIIVSLTLFILFLISVFINLNFTLGIISIFLFVGAVSGNNEEKYHHLSSNVPFVKNIQGGIKNLIITIPDTMPLYRILKFIKPDIINTFNIINNDMKVIKVISEDEMQKIFINNDISVRIGSII